jgi:hypothetical protein
MKRLLVALFGASIALAAAAQTPATITASWAAPVAYQITISPLTSGSIPQSVTVTWTTPQVASVVLAPNILAPAEPPIAPGTTAQYWRGDKTWQNAPWLTAESDPVFSAWLSATPPLYNEVDPRLPAPGTAGNLLASNGSGWESSDWLGTPKTWQGLQIWNAGGYIGGQASSDLAPEYTVIGGKSAWPGATVNTTGGPLVLSGGAGVSSFTVTDWTKLYGGQVQITLNDRLPNKIIYVLTEGIEFAASTSNNLTAQNLAAAINAWCPGVYATAFGAVVGLEKAPGMTNMAASLPANAPGLSIFNAGYGQTYLDGPVTTIYTISLQGDTIWPTGPTQAIDASNLNINASLATAIQLSGASAVTVAGVIGTPAPVAGKTLFLLFSDSNVTIPNNSPFALAAPYTGVAGGVLALRYDGSVWRELFRYPNFLSTPPTLSTSTGTPGQYSYDSNYFYICVAANTWRRVAVASW